MIKRSNQEQVVPVLPGSDGRRREVDPQEPDLINEVSDDEMQSLLEATES